MHKRDGLVQELVFNEVNEYVRHEIGVYFAWLSFFLAIILGAMAWVIKASVSKSGYIEHFPFAFVVLFGFFMIQIYLGVAATSVVIDDIEHADTRVAGLLGNLALPIDAQIVSDRLVPAGYAQALRLAKASLVANLWFWPLVALCVLCAWRYRWAIGAGE